MNYWNKCSQKLILLSIPVGDLLLSYTNSISVYERDYVRDYECELRGAIENRDRNIDDG